MDSVGTLVGMLGEAVPGGMQLVPTSAISRMLDAAPNYVAKEAVANRLVKQAVFDAGIDVAIEAGAGEVLLIVSRSKSTVSIYNIADGTISATIPLSSPEALVIGGRSLFVMVDPRRKIMELFSLSPLNRRLTRLFSTGSHILGVTMGSASDGPLLVMARRPDLDAAGTTVASLHFLETTSLNEIILHKDGEMLVQDIPERLLALRASADGQLFVLPPGERTRGALLLPIRDGVVQPGAIDRDFGGIWTGNTGTLFFSQKRGIWQLALHGQGMQSLATLANESVIPFATAHPALFLKQPLHAGSPVLCDATGRDLLPLPFETRPSDQMLCDPARGFCLKIIRGKPGRIERHAFDMRREANLIGTVPMFFTSVPPQSIRKGATLKYQSEILGNYYGIVKYKLEGAPWTMRISETGLIEWPVPPSIMQEEVSVGLFAEDESGQKAYQRLVIAIEPPVAGSR